LFQTFEICDQQGKTCVSERGLSFSFNAEFLELMLLVTAQAVYNYRSSLSSEESGSRVTIGSDMTLPPEYRCLIATNFLSSSNVGQTPNNDASQQDIF
jgi:hypothetical protein